jgi:WD40 repeat protein
MAYDPYKFDAFLCHSSRDSRSGRDLADRLKRDGIRVWFHEWYSRFPEQIQKSAHESRVLVLLLSKQTYKSEWTKLEQLTAEFRDPDNHDRKFLPVRLDKSPLPPSIHGYHFIDWKRRAERAYRELLQACRPVAEGVKKRSRRATKHERIFQSRHGAISSIVACAPNLVLSANAAGWLELWDLGTSKKIQAIPAHDRFVHDLAIAGAANLALSGSNDGTVKLWEIPSGTKRATFSHTDFVHGVALTKDGQTAISAGGPELALRVWDIKSGNSVWGVRSVGAASAVSLTPDDARILLGLEDGSIHCWERATGRRIVTFTGHTGPVNAIASNRDGSIAVSCSSDTTLRVWDLQAGRCLASFEGHRDEVMDVSVDPQGLFAASAALDDTVRLWDLRTGACLFVFSRAEPEDAPGPHGRFQCVAFAPDGAKLLAGTSDGLIYVYKLQRPQSSSAGQLPEERYTNAKVVLVGDTGVGKSGLGIRLAEGRWEKTESTHGMRVWPLSLSDVDTSAILP